MVRIEKIPAQLLSDVLSKNVGIQKVVGSFEAVVAEHYFFLFTYSLTQNS